MPGSVRRGGRVVRLRPVPKRPPTLSDLDPLLAELHRRVPELQGVWLFGSLARGSVRADSDIDLALLAREPLDVVRVFDLGLDLGVIASRDVDLVDLRRVSVLLRHIVCAEGRLLVAVDAAACDAFVATTAAMHRAVREEQRFVRAEVRGRS